MRFEIKLIWFGGGFYQERRPGLIGKSDHNGLLLMFCRIIYFLFVYCLFIDCCYLLANLVGKNYRTWEDGMLRRVLILVFPGTLDWKVFSNFKQHFRSPKLKTKNTFYKLPLKSGFSAIATYKTALGLILPFRILSHESWGKVKWGNFPFDMTPFPPKTAQHVRYRSWREIS